MKNIYRATALSLFILSLTGFTASAQIVNLLYSFSLDSTQGKGSVSGLIADQQGAFYGTTYEGGANGYGTVFKLTRPASNGAAWKEIVLYSFCSQSDCADGSYPTSGLTFGKDGALYGTTQYGGDACGNSGCGTIFKLSPPKTGDTSWTQAVVHHFRPSVPGTVVDGTNPAAGLITDQQGAFYGTTSGGGLYGQGTVFKLLPDTGDGWKESVINNFGSKNGDGTDPTASLIFDANGVLYGTTYEGGANGYGTIFKVTSPGKDETLWPETVLYSFAGGSDGAYPAAGLVLNDPSNGGLYGTTTYGGANCDVTTSCGTVFTLSPSASDGTPWTLSALHSFSDNSSDGQYPVSGVIFGEDGSLYGTTQYGGAFHKDSCGFLYNCGTIFTLTTDDGGDWKESVLYRFCDEAKYNYSCTTGAYPTAGLLAYQGFLYGTTSF